MSNRNDISKKKENEELSENLYTLLTNIPFLILTKHNGWSVISKNIESIKTSDLNCLSSNLGISSKCKFKHMDISDKLK
jgi:hypothetical protein